MIGMIIVYVLMCLTILAVWLVPPIIAWDLARRESKKEEAEK